jgi:hypothetical protein
MLTEEQQQAIRNLAVSIDLSATLPHRVFAAGYSDFYVMDFERLVRQSTVDLMKELIRFEKSDTVAIARFEEVEKDARDGCNDVFFLTPSTEVDVYWSFVRRNVAEFGKGSATPGMRAPWLIFAERIGACSNLGTWCIYGQKFAEIAVLGFKEKPSALLEKRLHSEFGIEKLADALKRGTFFGDPGNEHSKQQRAILRSAHLR